MRGGLTPLKGTSMEIIVCIVLTAMLSWLLIAFDQVLFHVNIAWWLCILIAAVVVFIGGIIIVNIDTSD